MRLLVIEDNARLRELLANGLRSLGFTVTEAADGQAGWEIASEARHDLVILDRMLPGLDGIEVLRRLRRSGSMLPVLLLTAKDTVQDRVDGLDAGADDYLIKPFAVAELLARVRMLLRRGRHQADPLVTFADLEVDTVSRSVKRAGRRIDLTPKEYQVLEYLVSRADAVVTRMELLEQIYEKEHEATNNVVDVLVGRLRKKLHLPGLPPLLHTRRGFGYQLAVEPA
jgi:DNA-binding response OmpR family regulator